MATVASVQDPRKQMPTDADLARAWGHREGYRAFVDLDTPLTAEQVFQAVQERWIEEDAEQLRLSAKLSAAQAAAMGAVDRLRELGELQA